MSCRLAEIAAQAKKALVRICLFMIDRGGKVSLSLKENFYAAPAIRAPPSITQHAAGTANLMPQRNYDGEIQMNTFEISIGSFTIKATGPWGVTAALAALASVFYFGT